MGQFKNDFILPASYLSSLTGVETTRPPPIVIAVLDTGVCIDDSDMMLCAGADTRLRRELSRNYSNSKGDWEGWDSDNHGHGTHIVRILLQNTVSAEIVVLKVAESRKMEYTTQTFARFIQVRKNTSCSDSTDSLHVVGFSLTICSKCAVSGYGMGR